MFIPYGETLIFNHPPDFFMSVPVKEYYPVYFCDVYNVESYGVAGDVYRLFLRDSSNTRVFVCDYYDNDIFEYFLNEGKIEIFRFENSYSIGGVMHNKRFINKYVFD